MKNFWQWLMSFFVSKPKAVVKPTPKPTPKPVAKPTTKGRTAYELAQAEIGTFEWAQGDNPKVVAYYADSGNAGVKNDSVAWCAAFVGAMLKRAGGKGTGLLTARSYLMWGVPVERKNAKPGDIVVFKRGNSNWEGHVAFFVKDNGSTLSVLGGNQSDAVNIKNYSASQLLGIRRAKE